MTELYHKYKGLRLCLKNDFGQVSEFWSRCPLFDDCIFASKASIVRDNAFISSFLQLQDKVLLYCKPYVKTNTLYKLCDRLTILSHSLYYCK